MMKKPARSPVFAAVLAAVVLSAARSGVADTPIIISGYMANPAGTDSPNEYIQLIATENIDFSTTNYSLVVANNGTATSSGSG